MKIILCALISFIGSTVASYSQIQPLFGGGEFTTLIFDSDFSRQMPINWLGGCPTGADGSPVDTRDTYLNHQWWMNIWWAYTAQPCIVGQKIDPLYGWLALDIPWVVDANAVGIGTAIQSSPWYSTDPTNTFPNNAYYEVTMRMSPTPSFPGMFAAAFTWPLLAMTDQSQEGLELDISEFHPALPAASCQVVHNFSVNPPVGTFITNGWSPIYSLGFYHTYGLRTISNGQNMTACSFIDGELQNCVPIPGGMTPSVAAERFFLIIKNSCAFFTEPCLPGRDQHLWILRMSVWSCPDWQLTQCNNTASP